MKNIFVIGAGLSTHVLIEYLLKHAEANNWQVTVGDINIEIAQKSLGESSRGAAIKFDVFNDAQLSDEIKKSDIVVSMLPARFHVLVAKKCLEFNKNLVTASYVSPEMLEMNKQAKEKGLLFLNEIGLDPGIDHMSAMQVIEKLKLKDAKITEFRSYTGGLIAPKYDNNPWNYKFTWNPRNVVVAGQATAKILKNGVFKYIPYHKLFERKDIFNVLNYGEFEGYANRDSLSYREAYGLQNVKTMIRGTLRRTGYCETWNIFVQLGLTDDTFIMENSKNLTNREFINSFLPYHETKSVEQKLCDYLNLKIDDYKLYRLRWLGIFDNTKTGIENATPAQILQKILENKWTLDKDDKDMIVMQHIFNYFINNNHYVLKSSTVVEGKKHTAMAVTVGTPAAIATKLILQGKIKLTGVQIPTIPEIYNPVMKELSEIGIKFVEEIILTN
ncbi:MAG: saccharopine dehydrogenase NADP-binding domain-containing protein [Bacteroidales bacterium]|nr:saccharopine dehydrogenase NADP-binding domain-containing protein [Bacteroidales bacterium]